MSKHKYEVGQKLWLHMFRGSRGDCEVTITKVGRRWVSISTGIGWSGDRFEASSGYLDGRGYTPAGRVYGSQAEYAEAEKRRALWKALRQGLSSLGPPVDVTAENIYKAADLLGLRPEVEEWMRDWGLRNAP